MKIALQFAMPSELHALPGARDLVPMETISGVPFFEIAPGIPYILFNLGNLYCLSAEHMQSIEAYTRAIAAYPYMGDAYYNRGLVLIYLKDKEKGCIDLSRAGELGVDDAYAVIKKYCEERND